MIWFGFMLLVAAACGALRAALWRRLKSPCVAGEADGLAACAAGADPWPSPRPRDAAHALDSVLFRDPAGVDAAGRAFALGASSETGPDRPRAGAWPALSFARADGLAASRAPAPATGLVATPRALKEPSSP